MSAENNNFMSMLTKKPLISLIVVLIVIGIIVVIVNMKGSGNNNNNTPKPTTNEEFSIENFPQSAAMNVMYSDASGNLSTTTDLGIQYLTVASDALITGNSTVTGNASVNGNSTVKGDSNVNGKLKIGNVYLSDAGDGTLRISNAYGYVDVGAKNTGWGHIYTDRPKFAFNAPLTAVQKLPYKDYAVYTDETSTKVQDSGNALMPSGMIMMWKGAVSQIPAGWVLCNGSNSTPNLVDRFIVGASKDVDAGGGYKVGAVGGENQVQLFKRHMPKHSHKSANTSNKIAGQGWPTTVAGGNQNSIDTNGVVTTFNDLISEEGEDIPHENRPPYYALCYIMKV